MIITIEKQKTTPYIVTCGHDKKEYVFLEDTLKWVAALANDDPDVMVDIAVVVLPAPKAALGPIHDSSDLFEAE